MKLKKGDQVMVTVGKDRGRKGKVEQILTKTAQVVVGGVNVVKRHMKKRDEKRPGGIMDITKPIASAKLVLLCPKCSKPTRIGYLIIKGERVRICRKCEQKI